MIYLIWFFGGVFIVLCTTMLYVYYRDRHFGMFLMGVTYGTSGLLAIALPHWWPLIVGFVMVWLLRLMGLEPKVEAPGEEGGEGAADSRAEGQDAKAKGERRKAEGTQ